MADVTPQPNPQEQEPRLKDWLFAPFVYIAGGRALALGFLAILATSVIGFLTNTHADGVLDLHVGAPLSLWAFPAEGVIDWLCLAAVLFVIGRLTSQSAFRAVDLFGTQAMARWPSTIGVAAAAAPPFRRFAADLSTSLMASGTWPESSALEVSGFGIVALVIIAAWVWMIALMYHSYSWCCNIKGARGAATFVAGVLVAEVLSKVALASILRP